MEYNIRQLSFGEVLDRSLRILIDNPVLLIGVAAFLGLPLAALKGGGGVRVTFFFIYILLAAPLVHAALIAAVADTYLNKPVTIANAFGSAWSIVLPFLGTCLLVYLTIGAIAGGIGALAFLSGIAARGNAGPLLLLSLFVAFPIIAYLTVRWVLIGQIMIVEGRFGMKALSRSSELVRGVWWRTVGILVVAGLVVQVPLGVLQLFWASIPVLGVILSGVGNSIAAAYSSIALIVYYFDRRCRVEDFDLRRLAEQIRSETVPGGAAITGARSI